MNMKFEIVERDAAGRIAKLDVKGIKTYTPLFLPVVHPKDLLIPPKELKREFKVNAIITNAYIIYKDPVLREKILEEGIKKMLEFDGIVETDSGSYQMLHYKKKLEITNREIVEFQDKIGSDIGNVLDIPTDVDSSYEQAKKELEITIERIKEGLELRKSMLLNGAIQGGKYIDLRRKSAEIVRELPVDIFAIGTLVPYLISYNYSELFKTIIEPRILLPLNKPVHFFGLGHPLSLPLSVAVGGDIFDSASYILYAKDNRYLTPFGTIRLEKLHEFPCNCPVCSRLEVKELNSMERDEKIKMLAKHNLWVILKEMRAIKQAIKEGILWELVILKAHAHPSMYKATKETLERYCEWFKKLDPIRKKSGFLYQSDLSELRSDFKRGLERLKERVNIKDIEGLLDYIWPFGQLEYIDNKKIYIKDLQNKV